MASLNFSSLASSAFKTIALALFTYLAGLVIYRLWFHPLSHFPGPRAAAITSWYAGWYEVVKKGAILELLDDLHRIYGPVVRIEPGKLHFSDPRAFDDIYRSTKFTKEPGFYGSFHENESSFGYTDPRLAKQRKEVIAPLFSRKSVLKLESVIQNAVDRLIGVLGSNGPNNVVNLRFGFMSVSLEIITTYCFARSYNAIEYPGFMHPILHALDSLEFFVMFFAIQYLPIIETIVFGMPLWFTKWLGSGPGDMQEFFRATTKQVDDILEDPSSLENAEHEIIYHHLLSPTAKSQGGKALSRASLISEASTLVGAGTETIANTCTVAVFHVLRHEDIKKRLKTELEDAWPDASTPLSLEKLESLPFLTGVIKEGLRLSHGIVSPLPRVVHETSIIAGVQVPPGAIVSIGHTFVHLNPTNFPDPFRFNPDRWVKGEASDADLVPFSRGPRMCLGASLGWAELYLILGNLFRKLELTLPKKRPATLEFHTLFIPHYKESPLEVYVDRVNEN